MKYILTTILFLCLAISTALACSAPSYHNPLCQPSNVSVGFVHHDTCPASPYTINRQGTAPWFTYDTIINPNYDPNFDCLPRYLARADRAWLETGPNPADPWFDPLLMKHSFYADLSMEYHGTPLIFPAAGYTGTDRLEMVSLTIPTSTYCGDEAPKSFINMVSSNSSVVVETGRNLDWNTVGNTYSPSYNKDGTPPTGSGNINKVPVVYPVKPRFPDIRYDSWWADKNAVYYSVGPGETKTLEKGIHFFDNLVMQKNSTLNVKVGKKGERTIIYIKGSLIAGDVAGGGDLHIRTVDESGNMIPKPVGCEESEYGEAMIISRGCIHNTTGNSNVFEVGVSIITLGGIQIRGKADLMGQILADKINTDYDVNAAMGIKNTVFRPMKTYQLDVPPATFGEDKNWAWRNTGCDFDKPAEYYEKIYAGAGIGPQIPKPANPDKYYDTMIVITPSEPITDGSITLDWSVDWDKNAYDFYHAPGGFDADGKYRAYIYGNFDGNANTISGTLNFTPTKNKDTIKIRIVDGDTYKPDLKITINFSNIVITGDNILSNNLMPAIITIKSDDDCSDYCKHDWGAWVVVTPATCAAAGSEKATCTLCGETKTRAIPKLTGEICNCPHDFSAWDTIKVATCDEEGYRQKKCVLCGEISITDEVYIIPQLNCVCEHDFSKWDTSKVATCLEDGSRSPKCAKCGLVQDIATIIPKLTGDQCKTYYNVEVKLSNAAYFSKSNPADGYIDLIKANIEYNFKPESGFNAQVSENKIKEFLAKMTLPAIREFNPITASNITITGNSIEIAVSQKKVERFSANTSVNIDDNLTIDAKADIFDTVSISAKGIFPIADSIAPIITRAVFEPMEITNDTMKIIDTLKLWFSEPLKNFVKKEALSLISGKKFEFNNTSIGSNYVAIPIAYNETGSYLPVNGEDSIRIEGGFEITDAKGVTQGINTIWIPLEVGKYKQNYEILVYPNPYILSKDDKVSVVVRPIKSRGEKKQIDLSGNITIIDPLGNNIVDTDKFTNDGKDLVWSWKGKNSRKRNVGSGTYQAIIQITNDADKDTKTYLKKIGVKN